MYNGPIFPQPTNPDYNFYAAQIRGMILNEISVMERFMDIYICEYFCGNTAKTGELMEIVMSTKNVTYQAKCEFSRFILEKNGHKTKSEATKMYQELVDKIGSLRNMIAHCPIDSSENAIQKFKQDQTTITFLKTDKTTTTPMELNKLTVEKWLDDIHVYTEMFNEKISVNKTPL